MKYLASLLIILFPLAGFAQMTEDVKIQKLIAYIENLKDARFIRNGDEYGPKEAGDHLRMKLKSAGSRVKTARDFIEGIASKSYFSGKPYQIKFSNGQLRNSGDVLLEELAKIETPEKRNK